jgi:hypothetical protein
MVHNSEIVRPHLDCRIITKYYSLWYLQLVYSILEFYVFYCLLHVNLDTTQEMITD